MTNSHESPRINKQLPYHPLHTETPKMIEGGVHGLPLSYESYPILQHYAEKKLFEVRTTVFLLNRVSITAIKHHDQKQVAEERVYFAYASVSLFIIREVGTRTQTGKGKLKLKQRPWRGASYRLTPRAQPAFS